MTGFFPMNTDLALLVLRLALGIIFLAHGPAKFTQTKPSVRAIGTLETLGALSLLSGLWVQAGAVLLTAVMLRAIYLKSQKWGRNFSGEGGWEFEFMLMAAALAVLLAGSGNYTLF